MSSKEFTEDVCEALYACRKSVASTLSWRATKQGTFRCEAKVLAEDGTMFDLTGHWQFNEFHNRRRWGFSLRYYGHVIRSYDMARRHKNPGESGAVHGPHKHRFKSSKIPRYAYKPNPPISDADPNQSLMDFLAEANIALPTDYQSLIFP